MQLRTCCNVPLDAIVLGVMLALSIPRGLSRVKPFELPAALAALGVGATAAIGCGMLLAHHDWLRAVGATASPPASRSRSGRAGSVRCGGPQTPSGRYRSPRSSCTPSWRRTPGRSWAGCCSHLASPRSGLAVVLSRPAALECATASSSDKTATHAVKHEDDDRARGGDAGRLRRRSIA